jgi:ribonuclease HI
MRELVINTDGGARGNPGPAGIGVVFSDENGEIVARFKKYIGETTNNVAEYSALLYGLEKAQDFEYERILCRLDSELVVKQLNKEYKVKNEELRVFYNKILDLTFFKNIQFIHIPRAKNAEADKLVNEAIDEHLGISKH